MSEPRKWYPVCGDSFELENACALGSTGDQSSFAGFVQTPPLL